MIVRMNIAPPPPPTVMHDAGIFLYYYCGKCHMDLVKSPPPGNDLFSNRCVGRTHICSWLPHLARLQHLANMLFLLS
jgi:hypothetical protein